MPGRKEKKVERIAIAPEVRTQISMFNNMIGGVRLQAGVPAGWVMTPDGKAFVPPPTKG
jgi:hypothetical protein